MIRCRLVTARSRLNNPFPQSRFWSESRIVHLPRASIALLGVLLPALRLSAAEYARGVSGVVFFDKNGDGVRQQDEPGFADVVVTLFGKRSDGHPLYLIRGTDAGGRFAFADALIGNGSSFTVSTGGTARCHLAHDLPSPTNVLHGHRWRRQESGARDRPFRTIAHAVSVLRPGDVLYIRQGEYQEYLSPVEKPLGGGTGWERPIVIAGMPGESVVVRPPDRLGADVLIGLAPGPAVPCLRQPRARCGEFDAAAKSESGAAAQRAPSDIRLINCELKNANGSAVELGGDDNQLINCHIHDNGRLGTTTGCWCTGCTTSSKAATCGTTPVAACSFTTVGQDRRLRPRRTST